MTAARRHGWRPPQRHRKGFVLIALVALITIGGLYFFISNLSPEIFQARRQQQTDEALAQAKEALVAYAVTVDLSGSRRLGDLPCPDRDGDGRKETSCGNAAGTTFQARRLGRLPWFDLGLPDIRDANAEGLWYAVSNNFKENTRTATLNSDSTGTITVRDANGNILFDGSGTSGVVAVIIAPGPPIRRQDGLQQDRSVANTNDPQHFLDNVTAGGAIVATEDNADFDEITTQTNGFFSGPVRDASREVIANDRIVVITRDEIMAAIEKRVVAEVRNCLTNYADFPANGGRYPWAADLATSAAGNYEDTAGMVFGRVPSLMCNTAGDGSGACTGITGTNSAMLSTWGSVPNCLVTNTWFSNWREQVFYTIADAYKPGTGSPTCGTCLTIDTVINRQIAIFVAGKKVAVQSRSTVAEKAQMDQYLEAENNNGDTIFVTQPTSANFNDRVLYR